MFFALEKGLHNVLSGQVAAVQMEFEMNNRPRCRRQMCLMTCSLPTNGHRSRRAIDAFRTKNLILAVFQASVTSCFYNCKICVICIICTCFPGWDLYDLHGLHMFCRVGSV